MPGSFQARFDGRCGACDEPIEPGEYVEYVDDELVHSECVDELTDRHVANEYPDWQ